jgi:hypothetical protein
MTMTEEYGDKLSVINAWLDSLTLRQQARILFRYHVRRWTRGRVAAITWLCDQAGVRP